MNKTFQVLDIEELNQEIKYLSKIYDIVRIVDPVNMTVLHIENGKLEKAQKEPCYAIWEKNERCRNCSSHKACVEKKRITKYEYCHSDASYMLSVPFQLKGEGSNAVFALELLNHVVEDLTQNNSKVEQTSDFLHALSRQTYEDALTGVLNRRYYEEKKYIVNDTEQTPGEIGFLLIDANHFKTINDVYGHMHGDEVLAKIGETLQKCFRSSDKIIRIGGDEFLIVLQDCDKKFLEEKATLIKRRISELQFEWMDERPSAAVGVAFSDSFVGKDEQIDELYKRADQEMYKDKMVPQSASTLRTILIVDDIEMNRSMIRLQLKNKFHLIEAESGEDALVILKTNHVDLMVTDIFMDPMNGYELMKNVRRNRETKNIPIIALTENEESSQTKAIDAGANIYIDKSMRERMLVKSILQLTGHDHGRRELFDIDFVLDSIPGAVIVCKCNPDVPDILYCSRGVHAITGVESDEFDRFLKENYQSIIHPEDASKFKECIRKIIVTKSRGEITFRSYKKDGTPIWLWFQARYIGEEDGCPIVEQIVLDVSNGKYGCQTFS